MRANAGGPAADRQRDPARDRRRSSAGSANASRRDRMRMPETDPGRPSTASIAADGVVAAIQQCAPCLAQPSARSGRTRPEIAAAGAFRPQPARAGRGCRERWWSRENRRRGAVDLAEVVGKDLDPSCVAPHASSQISLDRRLPPSGLANNGEGPTVETGGYGRWR